MTEQYYKIALLFNANKVYDRQVVEGIGQYIQASQCMWDIFVEDEFIYHTGYPSIQYFYSVFKKEFEMTPKEFRLNC